MPENLHCKICHKAIHVENFQDGMSKLRHHYEKAHPQKFKMWGKKAAATRKKNKKYGR